MATPIDLIGGIGPPAPEEQFTTLVETNAVRIERIVSHGQSSAPGFWYNQSQNEWVLLLAGAARLRVGDQIIELTPGTCVNLPAHTPHRVEWTSQDEPTIWLAVHY